MSWNWRGMRAVMRKDLKLISQNKMVWLPMILVPLLLMVLIPTLMVTLPALVPAEQLDIEDLGALFDAMPAALSAPLEGMTLAQRWVYLSANFFFAPMFLIVPLMVASVIGADSFVGEKERRTIEGLLYTPLTDTELFAAKVLTALGAALVVELLSFALCALAVNLGGYPTMGRLFFPAPTWWGLVFWLGPAISLAGLGATVLVSAKAKTFMEAQQTAGMLVLPIVFLMIAQVSGLFFLSLGITLLIGLLVWGVGIWLIWVGAKTFSRGEIIAHL